MGLQLKGELKVFGFSLGVKVNLGSLDIIGVRDSKFVFMETKTTRREAALDYGVGEVKGEQEQVDKPLKGGATKRTYTNTGTFFSMGPKSDAVEVIKEGTDGVGVPHAGERKVVSRKIIHKTSTGFSFAALFGIEVSRDVTTKNENGVKKAKSK